MRRREAAMAEVSKPEVESSTALVTGGAAGIGRATALALARDGFFVWVHGRNVERGNATVQAIEAAAVGPSSWPPTSTTSTPSNVWAKRSMRSMCW
jgi:NAD(P)-dependent dehydrogenase (short-subunit alcohol dehydrogenase family)